jgi:hypothetical protein
MRAMAPHGAALATSTRGHGAHPKTPTALPDTGKPSPDGERTPRREAADAGKRLAFPRSLLLFHFLHRSWIFSFPFSSFSN